MKGVSEKLREPSTVEVFSMRSFSVAVLMAIGILFCAPSFMVAQDRGLRIFGLSYGPRVRTSDSTDLSVRLSEDGRFARFTLTVSVRNYGAEPARYDLQVQMERGARSDVLEGFVVAPGAVARSPHVFQIDFAGVGGPGIPRPEPVRRARAELVLLNREGRVLDRRPFEVVLTSPEALRAQNILSPIKVATEVHSTSDSGGGYFSGGGLCSSGTRIDEPVRTNTTLLGYVLDYEDGSLTRRWCETRSGVHSLVYFEVHTFLRDRPRDLPRRFTRVMLTFEADEAPDTTTAGRGADKFPIRSVQASTASWLPGFRSLDARTVRVNARSIGHDNLDFPISHGQLSFDVTNTVREWMDGRHANHGFLITARLPRGEDLNAMNLRRLRDFRLEFSF